MIYSIFLYDYSFTHSTFVLLSMMRMKRVCLETSSVPSGWLLLVKEVQKLVQLLAINFDLLIQSMHMHTEMHIRF